MRSRGRGSAQVELGGADAIEEHAPFIRGEDQGGSFAVLAVADRDDAGQVARDLDAPAAVAAAEAALVPFGAGQVHDSSATFMISSREAAWESDSPRRMLNVLISLATTLGASVVWPSSGDSMYTVSVPFPDAMAKAPVRATCAPTSP